MSKDVEKQEQRDTIYGLIAANRNDEIKICSNCMNEEQEQKNINTNHADNLGLILLNMTNQPGNPQDKEMWIGYSGGTVHITNDNTGMFNIKKCDFDITVGNQETTKFNIKKCDFDITVGNQETTKCTKMGDINLRLKNSTGTTVT